MDVVINADMNGEFAHHSPLNGCSDWLPNFLSCLGFNEEQLPLGGLLQGYHQLADGKWLVATPIHWQATHNDAMIIAAGRDLALTEEASRFWFAEIAAFLSADGIKLHYHDANTWFFNMDNKPDIHSKSPHLMLHQSMMPILNTLDKTLYWQRLLTELQMFISGHHNPPSLENQLSMNGLWFHGNEPFSIPASRSILTNDEHLLACFPNKIEPLTLDKKINKQALLMIQNDKKNTITDVQEYLRGYTVRWFWNNTAYKTQKLRCWNWLLKVS